MPRRALVGGLGMGAIILLGLVANALIVEFPMALTTGDAHLQRWIGPDAARLSFLGLTAVVCGGALWVALRGTRDAATRPAWLLGAGSGACAGLLVAALYIITDGVTTSGAGLQIAPMLTMVAVLLGPLVVGLLAAYPARRTSAGAVAGFWFALVLALLADVGLLIGDSLFASRLLRTAWAGYQSGDALCAGAHGATLLGCAVGDDLGFAATLLILAPVLGLGLGVVAGLAGRLLARRRDRVATSWAGALRPVMIFSGFLAVVMVAELLGNLW